MLTDTGAYTFKNVGTANFAVPSSDGNSVVIGNDPTQQWNLVPGNVPFAFLIRLKGSGTAKAMEPKGDSNANANPCRKRRKRFP